jgi:hypothetical protein
MKQVQEAAGPLQWTPSTVAESFSINLLLCSTFVRYQLHGSSVIDNMILS